MEEEDEGDSGVVLSERVQRMAASGAGIDCSDVRVLPVLECRRAVRVQSAGERAAMRERGPPWAALGSGPAVARVDMAEVDLREPVGSGTFATVHRGVYRGQQVAVKVFNDKASAESLARELALSCALSHPHIVHSIGVGWQRVPSATANHVDSSTSQVFSNRQEEDHKKELQQEQQQQEQKEKTEPVAPLWKPVLVMEFCVLGSLFQLLYPATPESKTRRAAPAATSALDPHTRSIAHGIASALAHVHALGYAHFDLCSANVLVCFCCILTNEHHPPSG